MMEEGKKERQKMEGQTSYFICERQQTIPNPSDRSPSELFHIYPEIITQVEETIGLWHSKTPHFVTLTRPDPPHEGMMFTDRMYSVNKNVI